MELYIQRHNTIYSTTNWQSFRNNQLPVCLLLPHIQQCSQTVLWLLTWIFSIRRVQWDYIALLLSGTIYWQYTVYQCLWRLAWTPGYLMYEAPCASTRACSAPEYNLLYTYVYNTLACVCSLCFHVWLCGCGCMHVFTTDLLEVEAKFMLKIGIFNSEKADV